MNLIKPRLADTSDTSLRDSAKSGKIEGMQFDRAGFSADPNGGLHRDLFYVSPYLTCGECNGLVYIDASALRSRLALGQFEKRDVADGDDEDSEDADTDSGLVLPP